MVRMSRWIEFHKVRNTRTYEEMLLLSILWGEHGSLSLRSLDPPFAPRRLCITILL